MVREDPLRASLPAWWLPTTVGTLDGLAIFNHAAAGLAVSTRESVNQDATRVWLGARMNVDVGVLARPRAKCFVLFYASEGVAANAGPGSSGTKPIDFLRLPRFCCRAAS